MRNFRFVTLVVLLLGAFGAQSLVGRSEQSSAPAAAGGSFDALHFRPIGPASMSGRLTDLAVMKRTRRSSTSPARTRRLKPTNNGTTFEPRFRTGADLHRGRRRGAEQSRPRVGRQSSPNNRQSTAGRRWRRGHRPINIKIRPRRRGSQRIAIDPRNKYARRRAHRQSVGAWRRSAAYKTTDGVTWKRCSGRRGYRRERPRDGCDQQSHPVRQHVSAAADRVLHERRGTGQRHLEIDRRRRDMDTPEGRRFSRRSARSHRPRRLSQTAEHSLRGD